MKAMKKKFVIDPLLPVDKVHLFGGDSGAGKSTLLMQVLDKVRKGEDVAGYAVERTEKIIIFSGDSDIETCRDLEHRLGIEPFTHINQVDLQLKGDTELLESLEALRLRFPFDPDVLVLDPADLVMGIENFNNKRDVAIGFNKAQVFAKTYGITLICILHTNKTKLKDDFMNVFNRIAGSHSLQGYSYLKALLVKGEDNKVILELRGKNIKDQQVHLINENGKFRMANAMDFAAQGLDVLDVLMGGDGLRFGEIADKLPDIPARSLQRQLKRAREGGVLTLDGGLYFIRTQ